MSESESGATFAFGCPLRKIPFPDSAAQLQLSTALGGRSTSAQHFSRATSLPMADTTGWSYLVGPSSAAGAGSSHSHLLAHNVSLAQCLLACEQDANSCAAVDYVQRHVDKKSPTTTAASNHHNGNLPPQCDHSHKPERRSCFAIPANAWRSPCNQPQTENILAHRQTLHKRPPKGAKNVLLVIFDDLRVVDAPFAETFTPSARAFAASATTFLAAHAQTALCAPSRASFLSGRRPDLTRVHWTDAYLRQYGGARDWITLPQHFREHGYYVAAAGKMYHKMADLASLDPQSWSEPECVASYPYYGQGACPEKPEVLLRVFNTSVGCPVDSSRHPKYAFTDRQVLNKALSLLRGASPAARSGQRPFWLGVGFFKPHKPFVFPAELLSRVPRLEETPLPSNDVPPPHMAPMANIPELCTAHGPSAPEAQRGSRCARENVRMYHAAAAFSDGLLGELLEEVEKQKLRDDTLTVVMSDHGFALGEHGSWAKWTNWEVATRVPFAIRAPWLSWSHAAGRRVSTVVELVDLYPTVAELANVPLPSNGNGAGYAGIGGRSLAALMKGEPATEGGVAFSQIARCWPKDAPRDASSYGAMAQCDGVPSSSYAFFGYSMRTSTARYTEWVPTRWDAATERHVPQWDRTVGSELYDHSAADDLADGWTQRGENANLAPMRSAQAATLSDQLRRHFDGVLRV